MFRLSYLFYVENDNVKPYELFFLRFPIMPIVKRNRTVRTPDMVLLYIGVSIKIIYTQYFIQKSTTDFLQTLMFQ